MKKFILAAICCLATAVCAVADELTICNNSAQSYFIPFNTFHTDEFTRNQIVYSSDDLENLPAGAEITVISFRSTGKNYNFGAGTFRIEMSHTSVQQVTDGTFVTAVNPVIVYQGAITGNYDNFELVIPLQTPFTYTGGGLMVEITQLTAGVYQSFKFYGTVTQRLSCAYGYASSAANMTSNNFLYIRSDTFLPATKFTYQVNSSLCSEIHRLSVDTVGVRDAQLSWTGNASAYRVHIAETETQTTVADTVVPTTAYSFTGAQAATGYLVGVQAICAAGDTAMTVTTDFMTLAEINSSETFVFATYPIGNFEQYGWQNVYVQGQQRRQFEIGYMNPDDTNSTHVLCLPKVTMAKSQLTLPTIVIDPLGTGFFWLTIERLDHHPDYRPGFSYNDFSTEGMRVFVDGVEQGFISHIYSCADAVHGIPAETAAGYYTYSFVLSPGRHTVMLQGEMTWYQQINITQLGVSMQDASSVCLPPHDAVLDSITPTTARISWQAGGQEDQWQVNYRVDGGSYQTISVSYNPELVLTGLTPASNHTLDVQIQPICGGSPSEFTYTTQLSFETTCLPGSKGIDYLTLIGVEASTVCLNSWNDNSPDIRYSLDEGATWQRLMNTPVSLPRGAAMLLCGNNPNGFSTYVTYTTIQLTGKVAATGNVMSLVCDSVELDTIPGTGCFYRLFVDNQGLSGNPALITAPRLPATTLTDLCYGYMFMWTGIEVAPELPATVLQSNCYQDMFTYCDNIKQVDVSFTDWGSFGSYTSSWLATQYGHTHRSGYFVKPAALPEQRNTLYSHYIPVEWECKTKADYVNAHVSLNDPNGARVIGDGNRFPGDTLTIRVFPKEGYTFQGWRDGCMDNPRTIVLGQQDTVLYARIKGGKAQVSVISNDATLGHTTGSGQYECGDTVVISAVADAPGAVFLGWSDGSMDNPRQVVAESDEQYVALFALSSHTITLLVQDTLTGTVSGAGIYTYGDTAIVTATAATGYLFAQWSDGVSDNPRRVVVTQDSVLTAEFGRNEYLVSISCNSDKGYVDAPASAFHGDTITATAIPYEGNRFLMWADGPTDNPRQFVITKNLYATAIFQAVSDLIGVPADDKVRKVVIDGQMYILRDGVFYDVLGRKTGVK